MSLIDVHLEQIRLSCQGIDSLRFPPPKIFANALLSKPDITTLIRDTEPHERALFSVPAPPTSKAKAKAKATPPADPDSLHVANTGTTSSSGTSSGARRATIFNVASGEVTAGPPGRRASAAPRRHTAVAAVLGGEMHDRLRKGAADRRGELDVEVLLAGAEKLCTVYELPGARERIAALRTRHRDGKSTLAYYEARVAEQGGQLAAMDAERMEQEGEEEEEEEEEEGRGGGDGVWTEEDLRREEEEARMMEVRKRELQMRLKSMQKDLGGLRDMRA